MELVRFKTKNGSDFKITTGEVSITLGSLYSKLLNSGILTYKERRDLMRRSYDTQFNTIKSMFKNDLHFNDFYNTDKI